MSKLILPEKLPDFGITHCNKQRARLEAAGEFPRRVVVTARKHGYVEAEILGWLESKIAARNGSVAA